MPHCYIEYSQGVEKISDIDALQLTVFEVAEASNLFRSELIKVRSEMFANYKIDQSFTGFVHVCVKLLEGRTIEGKTHFSNEIFNALQAILPESISLTVELQEIERATYCM